MQFVSQSASRPPEANMDAPPPAAAQGPLGPKAQLTCEMCKRRKIKCDKLRPCTACRNAGTICVPVERARLPRGRSGGIKKKNIAAANSNAEASASANVNHGQSDVNGNGNGADDLKERVSMLEHTVQGLVHSGQASYGSAEDGGMSVLPGFSLWDVGIGLAENRLLNENSQQTDNHVDSWLSGISPIPEPEDWDKELHHRRQLMSIYVERVDSFLPIFHCASLGDYLISRKPYLDYNVDHPAPAALAWAVRYLAISSISDEQCFQMFEVGRQSLLARYQKTTQSALEKADYISTDDLTTLQAFVLFLLAIRAHDQGRRAWTMLSLALRIAQSLSLHESEPPFPVKPLEREMRHRLWHVIGILDIQAAFDRGSEPMLRSNCSMSEISSPSTGDPDSPFSITQPDDAATQFLHTDTRFLAIMAEAQCAFRALDVSELNASEVATPTNFDTKSRQHVATTFRQKSLALLPDPQSELITTNLDWCLRKLVNIVHAFLQLLSFRPIRSGNRNPDSPPVAIPRGSGLLLLTVKFLQALDQFRHDERSEPFRWFIRLFVPWHVLVVAIDEADACEDVLLRQNCQALIERFLVSFEDMLADVHRAMLQGSVERLMAFGWNVPTMNSLRGSFGEGQDVSPNS